MKDAMNDSMKPALKCVAVFCGSNFGTAPEHAAAAAQLGALIAQRGLTLVYGGTHKGLMGVLADAALAAGGTVVGVINRRLHERGHLHGRLTRHEVAPDLRARKARMSELADAFIALPGGLGTLEELLEAATLTQLGDHHKACGGAGRARLLPPAARAAGNRHRRRFPEARAPRHAGHRDRPGAAAGCAGGLDAAHCQQVDRPARLLTPTQRIRHP